jgi:hypothetical protein
MCVWVGEQVQYIKCDVLALGSELHVVHVLRGSSWESVLFDNLSRRLTSFLSERALVKRFSRPVLPPALKH